MALLIKTQDKSSVEDATGKRFYSCLTTKPDMKSVCMKGYVEGEEYAVLGIYKNERAQQVLNDITNQRQHGVLMVVTTNLPGGQTQSTYKDVVYQMPAE